MYENADNSDRDQQFTVLLNSGELQQAMKLLETWNEEEPWNGEVLMRMAVVHWLSGEPARTLRDIDAYLQYNPGNAEALARRAQALLAIGKIEDAEASLIRAEAIDPTTPGVLLNRALLHEEHGNFEQALISLSAYLEAMPTDHMALARRSHLHRQLGNIQKALADAQLCISLQPQDPEMHFVEALAWVALERVEEALSCCERSLQLKAGFLPSLSLMVDLLSDLGRLGEAENFLALLLENDPDSPNSSLLRARLAMEREQYDDALYWINRSMDDAPDQAHGFYRRGMIYMRKRDYASALADFQEHTRLLPTAVEGYEQQFMCYLEMNRIADALKVGNAAVELQPNNYRAQFNLGFAELMQGEVDMAKERFLLALSLQTGNDELILRIYLALVEQTDIRTRLGFLSQAVSDISDPTLMLKGLLAETLLESGNFEESTSHAKEIILQDPGKPFGYLLAIKSLCLLNRYGEALDIAGKGVAALPDDGQIRLARSMVLRDTGHPKEAFLELEQAENLLPGDPEVKLQRALVFGSQGKIVKAVDLLNEVINLNPNSLDGYFWLSYFLIHRKEYREALKSADKLLDLNPGSAEGHFMRGVALTALRRTREASAELAQSRGDNSELEKNMRSDPVIAGLLKQSDHTGPSRYLRGFRRLLHTGR